MSTINERPKRGPSSRYDELLQVNCWVGNSQEWVRTFFDHLDRTLSVKCVVLLGSSIRDRVHQRSDFDLLIVYDGDLKPKLNAPIEVDIRRYSVSELDRKLSERDEILCWALKYGIVAFDRDGVWRRLVKNVGNQIPLPSLPEAEERSHKSLRRAIGMLESGDEEAADDLVLAALTQIARRVLIGAKVFPASRPELPTQLRAQALNEPVADALEDAMFGDCDPAELVARTKVLIDA